MKKVLINLLGGVLVIAATWFGVTHGDFLSLSKTAFAVGDLTIDWGVPEGDPIFVVNNFAPGEEETRTVDVTNGASVVREVGVVGVEVSQTDGLGDQLDIVISKNGTDLYGGTSGTGVKTLNQFIGDGNLANPIVLTTLNAGETGEFTFEVSFRETAGNEYQGANITLDITLGLTGTIAGLPDECVGFDLSNANLIMGTQRGEILRGTSGRDVIFGLESGDLITGGDGDDCIVGGPGGDALRGQNGNDIILGNDGGDGIEGGDGNDQMFGGAGGDSLDGGAGNDLGRGGEQGDSLTGRGGNDQLFGEGGSDGANGGAGTDTCVAESRSSCEA